MVDVVEARALAVLAYAWHLLPPLKTAVALEAIALEDLGAQHGSYHPDTHLFTLSTRLFAGPLHALPQYDILGNDPPQTTPVALRGLTTSLHELAHALGAATGLDTAPEWLGLSGWAFLPGEAPQETYAYVETRPGWDLGTIALEVSAALLVCERL